MDAVIRERANEWAKESVFDESTRSEIQQLLDGDCRKELEDRFYQDLHFGTGGMRAVVGAGTNRLNSYNIWRASQAVVDEIKARNISSSPKVVVGYDCRNSSRQFAEVAAGTFALNGIGVMVFREPMPVPLVSFSVRYHDCVAGVMITASHNPPEYNGYKVYWSDGAQVSSPRDGEIMGHFNTRSDYSLARWMNFGEGLERKVIGWVEEATVQAYRDAIKSRAVNGDLGQKRGKELAVIYTALHGTGELMCRRALEDLGMVNVVSVKEQSSPDGNFPTVSSPNPENPEALRMAVDLMVDKGGDIAMGTDPDTDRVGAAVMHQSKVYYPNGNQLGTLMLYYLLHNKKERGTLGENPYFIKTVVTTPLQEIVAKSFGVAVENTLTGFKWICCRMNALEQGPLKKNFIFATEESFGYLHHPFVRDKDAVASTALLAEMALWYKVQGKTLIEALDDIYQKYGFSEEKQIAISWPGKEGMEKIKALMERFRRRGVQPIVGQSVEVVEDYLLGRKTDIVDGKTVDLNFPSSNVLGFHLSGGISFYLRPSGTEPKIKFYLMIHRRVGTLEEQRAWVMEMMEKLATFVHKEAEKA